MSACLSWVIREPEALQKKALAILKPCLTKHPEKPIILNYFLSLVPDEYSLDC